MFYLHSLYSWHSYNSYIKHIEAILYDFLLDLVEKSHRTEEEVCSELSFLVVLCTLATRIHDWLIVCGVKSVSDGSPWQLFYQEAANRMLIMLFLWVFRWVFTETPLNLHQKKNLVHDEVEQVEIGQHDLFLSSCPISTCSTSRRPGRMRTFTDNVWVFIALLNTVANAIFLHRW